MVAMRLSISFAPTCATLLAAGAFLLTGCGGGAVAPDKARGQVVAEAAGGSRPGAALDRWLLKSPVLPNKVVGSGFVSAWINTALLIDAVRRNTAIDDPATSDSAISDDAARGMVTQFMISHNGQLPPVTEKQIDSLLALDRVRVFQQIVFRAPPKADSATIRKIVLSARALVGKLQSGGDFAAAVKQYSEDTASRARGGFLPALTESDLPPALAPVWNLAPGNISPPVSGGGSLHIFRRAKRDESRGALKAWLAPRLAQRADSVFVDSLLHARGAVIATDARLRLRKMAVEPIAVSEGGPFVTWTGGVLTPAEVRQATLMLLPADRVALSDASDTVATQFLMGLTRRELILSLASKEPPPSAEARAALVPKYRRALDSLRAAIKRLPSNLSAADAAAQYIDSVLAQRAPFLPLPGNLAAILRGRGTVKVNQPIFDGVVQGASLHWRELHKSDSAPKNPAAVPPAQ
jgi:hypothetical protein